MNWILLCVSLILMAFTASCGGSESTSATTNVPVATSQLASKDGTSIPADTPTPTSAPTDTSFRMETATPMPRAVPAARIQNGQTTQKRILELVSFNCQNTYTSGGRGVVRNISGAELNNLQALLVLQEIAGDNIRLVFALEAGAVRARIYPPVLLPEADGIFVFGKRSPYTSYNTCEVIFAICEEGKDIRSPWNFMASVFGVSLGASAVETGDQDCRVLVANGAQ